MSSDSLCMDMSLVLKRNTEKSDKILFGVSATATSILALASAILSYSALRQLAVDSAISENLSYLFPITIDGLLVSGSTMVLFAADRGKRSPLGITLTLLGVIASIAGNVSISPDDLTARLVHGTPPVVLFLSLEALTSLMRRRIRESITRQEFANSNQEVLLVTKQAQKRAVKPTTFLPPEGRVTSPIEAPRVIMPTSDPVAPTAPQSAPDRYVAAQPSIPQQIRDIITAQDGISVEDIAAAIDHPDKKYVRRIARQEIEKITAA